MKKSRKTPNVHKKKRLEYFWFTISILVIFFLAFLITYFLTFEYITRASAVSLAEESSSLESFLSSQDLNNLYSDSKNKSTEEVIILGYHQIREVKKTDTRTERLFITPPEVFEQEMAYLKENGYQSIFISQYLNYLKNPKANPIPKKTIVITFDDGYRNQYENAFPILKKYNLKATFFIYSDCINKYPICMTSGELKELVGGGMKLGNHTEHHIYMTDFKDSTLKKDILDNKKFLEAFGKESFEKVLAYPYGLQDQRVKSLVRDLDYLGAVGVSFYANDLKDPFNLPRYLIGENIQNFYNVLQ